MVCSICVKNCFFVLNCWWKSYELGQALWENGVYHYVLNTRLYFLLHEWVKRKAPQNWAVGGWIEQMSDNSIHPIKTCCKLSKPKIIISSTHDPSPKISRNRFETFKLKVILQQCFRRQINHISFSFRPCNSVRAWQIENESTSGLLHRIRWFLDYILAAWNIGILNKLWAVPWLLHWYDRAPGFWIKYYAVVVLQDDKEKRKSIV
jgi:hypothetical protein